MEVRLILTAFTVNVGLTYGSTINENFQNLFDSIGTNKTEDAEIFRQKLKHEVAREQQVFDTMKEEMRQANNRRHLYTVDPDVLEDVVVVKRFGPMKKEKLVKERYRTEKGTPLDLAWRKDEIRDALQSMGFNAAFCKERQWKKHIPEPDRDDRKVRLSVRRLCDRYLLPTDADLLEAHRRYKAQVAHKSRFEEMVQFILAKLTDSNETQAEMLNKQEFVIDDSNNACYWKVYYAFARSCADPNFDIRVQSVRNIFANACQASWLNQDKIAQSFSEVCSSLNYP